MGLSKNADFLKRENTIQEGRSKKQPAMGKWNLSWMGYLRNLDSLLVEFSTL
jgi:hypothetical protein